jgi:hypothetical protein
MSSIINTSTYFRSAALIVQKEYSNSTPQVPLQYPAVFNMYKGDPDRKFFQYMSLVGFGTLAVRGEGETPALDASKEGLLSYFAYTTYALAYRVTKEAIREDAKSIIPKLPGLLRYSSDQTKEYLFWNTFNFAFNNLVLMADGQPLCSTAHPLQGASVQPGVTTYSNSLGAVPLTVETLQQAYLLSAVMPDDRGLQTSRTPVKLIYPPGLHQVAHEVLSSGYYPSTDENRVNVVAGSIDPMPVRYLTSNPTGPFPWFVLAAKGDPGQDSHSVFASVKWDEQRAYYDDPTQSMVHETEFRAVWGAVDARGVVGSQGG